MPHDEILNAEQAVLGAAMISTEAADMAVSILAQGMFTSAANKVIFAEVVKLRNGGKPVDLVTLVEALGSRLEQVGGMAYLSRLSIETPTAANVEFYIRLVQENHRKKIFGGGLHKAFKAMQDGGDYIREAQKAITAAAALSGNIDKPTVQEWLDTVLEIGKRQNGIKTGYQIYDFLTGGLKPGHVTVIAGRTSMGKTSFALGLAVNAALQGKVVAVFSLEMPKKDIMRRGCHFLAKVSEAEILADTYGKGTGAATAAMMDAAERLSRSRFYAFDDANTLAKIRESCWEIRRKEGRIDVVMIDYLGLIRPESGRKNGTREQEVSENSRSVKRLAIDLGASVLLLSQMNRLADNREDPTPRLSDLRESGSVEQDADECLFLYRPAVYGRSDDKQEAVLIVAKNRYGRLGDVNLRWYGDQYRYADPPKAPVQTTITDDPDCPFE